MPPVSPPSEHPELFRSGGCPGKPDGGPASHRASWQANRPGSPAARGEAPQRRAGAAALLAKTGTRSLALRAFINHPEVFEDADNGLAFLQPQAVMEFVAPEEGIAADVGDDRLRTLESHAKEIFQAELRDEFCEALLYQDGDEVKISIRHGAVLKGGRGKVMRSLI